MMLKELITKGTQTAQGRRLSEEANHMSVISEIFGSSVGNPDLEPSLLERLRIKVTRKEMPAS